MSALEHLSYVLKPGRWSRLNLDQKLDQTSPLRLIIFSCIYQYYNGPGVSAIVTRNDVYNNLLKNYPLETLVTLYGTVSRFNVDQTTGEVGLNEEADNKFNNELIQKIINFEKLNSKNLVK